MPNPLTFQRKAGAGASAHIMPAILNPLLGLMPRKYWDKTKDFFVYSLEFKPLAASATSTQVVAIGADSAFLILMATGTVTDAATDLVVNTTPPELVTITDSGSARQLSDKAVHFLNLFGTAQNPSVWPFPKIMPPSSTLSVQIQNLEAVARNVRLSFLGFKVFDFTDTAG